VYYVLFSYQTSRASGSSVNAIKTQAKENVRSDAMLRYILQNKRISQQKLHIFSSISITMYDIVTLN
jgi:hypothetical protein